MKNKWLSRLKKKHGMRTDRTDIVNTVSVLSVHASDTFWENNMVNGHARTDRTDTVNTMSVLSVHTQGDFLKKDGIHSQKTPINRTDKTDIVDQYEERVAIAEFDGGQNTSQAHRIAYQDAIITTLNATTPDSRLKDDTDWFLERVKTAQDFLMTQGIPKPE